MNSQEIRKATETNKLIGLIHKIYLSQIKNSRKYTASTKTKSEVRGGGRKPWKQKGTGHARAGSSRSPLWVGGGVAFGPKPRIVKRKINKKEKRIAILAALALKAKQIRFYSEDAYINNFISTHKISLLLNENESAVLRPNKKATSKILIITKNPSHSMWLSTRGLKNVELIHATCINIRQILEAKYILVGHNTLSLVFSTYSL